MKTKVILFVSGVLLSSGVLQAQANQECATTASLAYSDAKAKNYEAAFPRIQTLRQDCPSYSIVTYQYGEIILKDKLKNAPEAEKQAIVEDLIKLYEERIQHFPAKTDAGKIYVDIAQLQYDNKIGTTEEQYAAFDKAFKENKDSFNAKSLYTYFNLLIDLQDAGKKELQDVFTSYDSVTAAIEQQENELAAGLGKLVEKKESGETLTAKEEQQLNAFEINLKAYSTVRTGVDGLLGQRADCDNLIPLFTKDFEARKTDVNWLKSAAGRLSGKDCTEDPLFFKMVEALHKQEPSAKSALYLGQLAEADGNASKALEYYNQSAELETNASDKARVYMMIANNNKQAGRFGQARTYYRRALDAKPSTGRAYLSIADMIAQSANNCGNTTFEKRAVYWLAARYAERAGQVDPSIASNANQAAAAYHGRAPQKADIFSEGMAGKTISVGCWIGESVKVPTL